MNRSTSQKIVFTDIDGTLINIYTGRFEGTDLLAKKLGKMNIPIIFCSAKTRSEQEYLRSKIGLTDPFIIENGGAVVIPEGYFDDMGIMSYTRKDGYNIIEIGGPTNEVRKRLSRIREELQISFKGTKDMTLNEISKKVKIPLPFAKRMSKREYGETIIEIDPSDLVQLSEVCKKNGLQAIPGGRYIDITQGNDKGKATHVLVDLFKKKYQPMTPIFIGLGDSQNDLPMLKLMDIPVLVQRPDNSWCESNIKNLVRCTGVGPKGWKNAFNLIATL